MGMASAAGGADMNNMQESWRQIVSDTGVAIMVALVPVLLYLSLYTAAMI